MWITPEGNAVEPTNRGWTQIEKDGVKYTAFIPVHIYENHDHYLDLRELYLNEDYRTNGIIIEFVRGSDNKKDDAYRRKIDFASINQSRIHTYYVEDNMEDSIKFFNNGGFSELSKNGLSYIEILSNKTR